MSAITEAGGKLTVHYTSESTQKRIQADRVVNAAGRIANVDALDLDAGNVAHDGIAVSVDAYLRSTSNPAVWVAGDALVTSAQLSPLATYEGEIVGKNIVEGATHKPEYAVIPSCVYTVPALASVGLSEQEAESQGIDVTATTSDMTGWFSGRSYAESVTWSKVLVDKSTDQIVAAHMVGHQGEDLIHLFAMAIKHGITASAMKETIFAFPTFASDVKNIM